MWAISSAVRASVLHTEGRRFETCIAHHILNVISLFGIIVRGFEPDLVQSTDRDSNDEEGAEMRRLLIVLVLLSLISLAVGAAGCGGGEEITPTPKATFTAVEGFKTYNDTVNDFSISYPENWDQIPSELLIGTLGEMAVVGFWPPVFQPDDYPPSFHILLEELPFTMGVDTYWESAKRYLPSLFANYTALSTESTTINGVPAIVHVFTFTSSEDDAGSWQCKFIKVALVKDSGAWIITCESTVPYFDDYKDTFDAVISSFRFTD